MNQTQRFSDKDLLEILALSQNATAIYSGEQIIIQTANDAMIQFWGKDRSVIGHSIMEAVPELIGQPFIDLLKNVWNTGITYEAKEAAAELKVNDELQLFYFDFVYRAIKNDDGEMVCILHTALDVTERVLNRLELYKAREKEKDFLREQELNLELAAINEELTATNEELQETQQNLRELNETLEDRVASRTKKLSESQDKLNQAIETGKMSTWSIDPQTLSLTMSDFIKELFGFSLDKEVEMEEILRAVHPDYIGPLTDVLTNAIQNHQSSDIEYPITNVLTGEEKWVRATGRIFFDNEGNAAEYSGMLMDTTAQVHARQHLEQIIADKTKLEKDLRENQQRLQGILDTMAEGVIIIDENRQLVYANPMSQQILGLAETEIMERMSNDDEWQKLRVDGTILPVDEYPTAIMMSTGKSIYDYEIGIQPPDKERFYISINAAPVFDHDGKITGGITTFMDVTNRRKITQQKDEFISVASHELKTPITTLKASLQLLDRMKNNPSPDLMAKLITQSIKSLDKLNVLVSDLLNVNRITQGQLQLRKTTFNLAGLINDCCNHIRSEGTHEIILKGELDLEVNADEHQIDQVVVNLANNAVKYAPDAKEIVMTITKENNCAKVAITDHGQGIHTDKIPYLFERYYRADYSGLQFSGLGLGLYICAEIIKKHDGQIGVESEIGKGSTFWFTLPLS